MKAKRDAPPLDANDLAVREKLLALAKSLLRLHSALLDDVKADYERQHGPVGGPFALFGLVTRDPFFAWLRPLSSQMALLDELIDEKRKLSPDEVSGVRRAFEALFTPDQNEPEGFAANYLARLSGTPEVAIRHQQYRSALQALPAGEDDATPGSEEGGERR